MEEEERLLHYQPLITILQQLKALAKEDNTNKQIVASNNKPGVSTPSIIPFLASIPAPRTLAGVGVREVTGNKIDYIYWDDPKVLLSRLRLLWLSREAGNTGVNNEIDAIIEDLQECGMVS